MIERLIREWDLEDQAEEEFYAQFEEEEIQGNPPTIANSVAGSSEEIPQ